VAKQLLMHEDHKLDRVAEMTGFVDGSHLSRVFRLHTGRSPGQYRIGSDRLARKHSTASIPCTDS
jgi:transcriptional regulator GlxA family with amidase domain